MRARSREMLLAAALLLPLLGLLGVVVFYPLVQALLLSVRDAQLLSVDTAAFVGLENFRRMVGDDVFWEATANTFLLTAISVGGALTFGMSLALFLNEKIPFRNTLRGLALIPWVTSGVVISMLWLYMFNSEVGIINDLLTKVGITDNYLNWYSSQTGAVFAVAFANIWHQTPFYMLMLLAALQTVPHELYEAAKVDGAGVAQRFRHVTIPGIRGVLGVVVILQIVWNFNNFDLIWATTEGGPLNATTTLAIYTYQAAFDNLEISYAAAVGLVLLVFLLCLAAVYLRFISVEKEEDG